MAAESSHPLQPARKPSISFGPPRFGSSNEMLELPSPSSDDESTPLSRPFSRVSNRLRRSISSRLPSLRERSHETDRDNCPSPVESINPITPEYLAYLAHCPKSDPVDTVEECPLEVQQRCGRQLRDQENGNLTMDMVTPSGSSAHSYLEGENGPIQEACIVDQAHGQVEGDNASFTSSVYDQDASSQEGIDAPVTPPIGTVFASEDLSKYSRANDNLDNLMSDYASRNESVDEVVHPAAADAELADQGWHSFVVPMTTTPTSSNKVPTPSPELIEVWKRSVRQGSQETPTVPHTSPLLSSLNGKLTVEPCSAFSITAQLDGISERRFLRSTETSEDGLIGGNRRGKRKASTFSLRSLSASLATSKASKGKRQRLSLRSFASNVASSLNEVSRRIKERHVKDRQSFGAQRARRRAGKSDNTVTTKSSSLDVHTDGEGNASEEWWQEGVSKYGAPSWMKFGSAVGGDALASKMSQLRFRGSS